MCDECLTHNEDQELPNAWLTDKGKFIWVEYMGHAEYAIEYCEEHEEEYEEWEENGRIRPYMDNQLGFLYQKGWVRLLTWREGETSIHGQCESDSIRLQTEDPRMNSKQISALKKWAMEKNIQYESLFK
jgi:hypothetical protein